MRKVPVVQQVPAGRHHERGDVRHRVAGGCRWPEPGYLLGQDRREHMVFGRVVAVERAERHAGFGGDLLGADALEILGCAQPSRGCQDRAPAVLLIVGHRAGRCPWLSDPRHVISIGDAERRGASVPISGTTTAVDAAAGDDRCVSYGKYGPWAVVAGGSEGVGAEFARLLAGSGVNLVLVARKPAALEATAQECRELGVEVHTLAIDLVDAGSVANLIALTDGLEVGLLIYNAGANTCSEEFLDADLADFQRVIELNITTMMTLVQHYGRAMRERRRGGILLVGSMAGYLGSVCHTVYGGVKAYGRIFAEGLWLELRDHNVDVLELVLGVTRTPAMERVGLNFDIPGMKVADPAEVAREGLDHLADGPVHVAGGNGEDVARRNDPDRAKVVVGTHRMMQRLLGRD